MDVIKPTLNPEEQAALSSFITRKIKEFDPDKGTLGSWVKVNVLWWFDKQAKGEVRG